MQNNFHPAPSFRSVLDADVKGLLDVVIEADSIQPKGEARKYGRKTHLVRAISSVAVSGDRDRITLSEGWEDSHKFGGSPVILSVLSHGDKRVWAGPMTVETFVHMFTGNV